MSELEIATEKMMDALLTLAEGRDDDDLMFIDGAVRSVAEHLNVEADWNEIEPMTAGEFRRRYRAGKSKLAAAPRSSSQKETP